MSTFEFSPVLSPPREFTVHDWRQLGRVLTVGLCLRKNMQVGVAFVSEKRIQELNRQYRHKSYPTDVLSFSASENQSNQESLLVNKKEAVYLGDLVICPAYAKREAKRRGIVWREELARLLIHGILHLLGYDHATPTEEARMFSWQEKCVERMQAQEKEV